MAAVAMWLRAQARTRWRTWLALALVLGVVGGAGIAAAVGARRTETAYPRFMEKHDGFDVILGGIGTDDKAERDRIIAAIIARPEVKAYATGGLLVTDRITLRPSGTTVAFPEIFIGAIASPDEIHGINRPEVIEGRLFDPTAEDEAILDFLAAERLGIRVGQRFDVPLTNQDTGQSVTRSCRIVGITVEPWDMPAVGQASLSGMTLTPAFLRANRAYFLATEQDAPSVQLRRGSADIPAFVRGVEALDRTVDIPATRPQHLAGVRKTLRFEVSALWLLAALVAGAALAIVGQALARQAVLDGDDNAILRSIAMSRGQLFSAGMIRAAAIGTSAAMIAIIAAVLASPLTPRGLARVVEPSPGFTADWAILAIGGAATVAISLLASVVPAWRATRIRTAESVDARSRIAGTLADIGASPSVVTGIRLALDPGRGRRALPVRSTIAGISVALAAFWAAVVFTQSLGRLIDTPAYQGYAWDVITTGSSQDALEKALRADPDVVATSAGGVTNVVVEGERLIPFTFTPGKIAPVILHGRSPRADDEIALGTRVLARVHKRIGDTVSVKVDAADPEHPSQPVQFRVVGTTVVPPIFFEQVEPGHGSAITIDGYRRVDPTAGADRGEEGLPIIIRYRPGVDLRDKLEGLRKELGYLFTFQLRQPGAELAGVSRSQGLPLTLTEILLFMAAATLVHALVTAVRKRRHDLAILKTLGFSRRQVQASVAWQASTFVVLALVVGLPLGTVLGRWAWKWFVDTIGLVPFTVVPSALIVLVVIAATFALANLIALLPGRAAARTKPALVLRTE